MVGTDELVDAMALSANITPQQARAVLDAFVKITTLTLRQGGSLAIDDFALLRVRRLPARGSVDPRTSTRISIPAENYVVLVPSKELTESLN